MTRNRLVQLAAILVAAACIVGAAWITPRIEEQRHELQLTSSDDLQANLPPQIAVATAALGSFRGLMVDVMWYRLEMLKRDGKFHEANTLSQWITTLQPRFPQVWSFMAWNMAYNISVATYTPDERLDWVNKGIDLLRDKGIPYNPNAIRLYRELGWIFFHKVGQYSDDQHWYYKIRLAQEWQEVLGAEAEGGSTQQRIDAFRAVAEAYDKYVNQQRPTHAALAEVDALLAAVPAWSERLNELKDQPLKAFERKLARWRASLSPKEAAKLDRLASLIDEQVQRGAYQPEQLIERDDPAAGAIVRQLAGMGLPPQDEKTMRTLGRARILVDSGDARALGYFDAATQDPEFRPILSLFIQPETKDAMARAMAFYRALTLVRRYHMDPNWMLHLMENYGPVDWRHSAAHSLYWSSLGVHRAIDLRNKKDVDFLNTKRQVIHSLQQLTRVGRISYDPTTMHIDELPDPRFIAAYEKAVWEAGEEIQKEVWGSGTVESFDSGYENFLIDAVRTMYLYGDEQQARDYYRKAKEKFGDLSHNDRSRRYEMPLDEFVTLQFVEDSDMMQVARPAIDAMLRQGIVRGLGNNQREIYARFRNIAQVLHRRYQAKAIANPTAVQDRMRMPSFKEVEENTYIGHMNARAVPIILRMRIWRNTPLGLQQDTYARLLPDWSREAQEAGEESFDVDRAFPAPPGALLREVPTVDQKADEITRPTEGIRIAPQ